MTTALDQGFVDVHHHLIYGVDDGPGTLEESLRMLALAYQDGTRHLIATPHFDPVGHCPDVALLKERLGQLQAVCDEKYPGLRLYLGAEVLYGEGVLRQLRSGLIPTLAGSDHVLVEFVPDVTRDNLERAVRHLASGGYVTILAHCERYPALTRDIPFAQYLREKYGALLQINADFVLRRKTFRESRFLKKALKQELIDLVASDAHDIHDRRTRLMDAHAVIAPHYPQQFVRNLFTKHAEFLNIQAI